MKHYVEAYYADGSIILGNCNGQGIIYAKNYKRTDHYKSLKLFNHSKVHHYKILTPYYVVVETIERTSQQLTRYTGG